MLLGGFSVLNDSNCFWSFVVNCFNHLIERLKGVFYAPMFELRKRSIKNSFEWALDHLKCVE